jgi:hypothetical protein
MSYSFSFFRFAPGIAKGFYEQIKRMLDERTVQVIVSHSPLV